MRNERRLVHDKLTARRIPNGRGDLTDVEKRRAGKGRSLDWRAIRGDLTQLAYKGKMLTGGRRA